MVVVTEEGQMFGQQRGPEVQFHVGSAFPPQQGGPPGGPQLRGLHHPNHGANPSIPPPHQQQPPPPPQSQHSAGPPGPAPTSTPPGPADMGKQGPHLQGQPPIPQGGQMQLSYGVPNQQRPSQAQSFFPGAPRGPTPRMPNHRGQVVNMPTNNVSQQIFPSHVPVQQLSMYSSHVVPTPINPNQMLFTPGQMQMFTQTRHQNTGTNFYPPTNQQHVMMPQHQLFSAFQSSPQSHQFFFPGMRSAGVGGAGGVGGPGLGSSGNQQVVVPGAPPQMGQGAQVPIMSLTGGNVLVSGIAGDSGGSAGPVGGGGGGSSGKQARRKYALDIVDPNTMKNVDIYEPSGTNTPPRSGDSSARETPQPTTGPGAMDVVADFAARVAKAASEKSSASTPSQLSTFVEPSSSIVPAQVLNVNGPDHMGINNIVTSSEGILNQSDSSISKSQIVVVEESSASSLPWKPQTQLKAPNIGNKMSSGNKNNKIESSLNKMDEPILVTKVESDSKSIVKIQPERECSLSPGVPSVSAKDMPIQLVTDVHVTVVKEHQPVLPISESNAIPQDETPVVSALINSPIVDVVHQHRAPQREQIPGKSSPVKHTSPRRKREGQVTTEKPGMPQNVSLVPTIAVVSSQVPPSSLPEVKPREPSLPPFIEELKSQKKSEVSVEDLPTFSSPMPKERRELEKTSRSREKSSQSREIDRLPRETREKSQVQEREKSSQNRSKENTAPGIVSMPIAPAGPIPQLEVSVSNSRLSTKPETTSVAPQTHVEDVKHQPNGDSADGPEGKSSQRSKSKRASKMRDFNRKGAEKEGTDMDAFSESPSEEAPPVPTPSSPALSPASANKVSESQTAKSEESEADKEEEKLVAVRNEENNKVSAAALKEDSSPVIESTPTKTPALKYIYKEDQWSPVNPDGKKKYEREFLMGLKNEPQSKRKPDNLPDIEVVLKDNRQRPVETSRPHDAFTPKFLNSGSNSRGPPPKRNSQQGKAKGGKPTMIHVSLSLKEDVKLRETENAWRPGRMNKSALASEQDAKTEDLYKKVRGVLNKLTPQKFQTLVEQVQSLPIDNSDRLQGVINLVFEKAVDEPSFSVAYAQMCKVLSDMQVPAERKSKDDAEFVNFRKLLVNRCQHEFEKSNELELNRDEKLKEIENTEDAEKKKELQQIYEEEERRVRMKSVGNIRFIGELFKLQMLTTNIMHRCIKQLLSNGDEESLECLCKLLTTIGKDLETKKQDLGPYFTKMQEISNKRGEVSSRVRFMIQDVIELRQGKWVPRRDDSNPKTIDQIQREAEKESMESQMLLSAGPPASRRQDDRNSGNERRKRGVTNVDEDGWLRAGRSSKSNYPVDTSRLKQKAPEMDNLSLGRRSMFTNWNNSQIKSSDASKKSSSGMNSNFYAALQDIPSEEKKASLGPSSSRPGAGNSTPSPLIEKERMLSSFMNTNDDSQSSRGNSVPQSSRSSSRDNSSRGDDIRSIVAQPLSVLSGSEDVRKNQTGSIAQDKLTEDQIKSKASLLVAEFLSNNNLEEASLSVAEIFGPNYINGFIVECLNLVVEKSSHARQRVGVLMSHLINNNVITGQQYLEGFAEIVDIADDLSIDVPKIWLYLAEIIAPMLSSETLTFLQFRDVCNRLSMLVVEVLPLLVKDKGPNWIFVKWNAANIKWTDFVEPDKVDSFIKQHKLEYTLGAASDSQALSPTLKMEEIQAKLVQFLKPEHGSTFSFDQICDWIGANVGDRISEPQFIRALMTALCESAVSHSHPTYKLNEDTLMNHSKFFQKYVDHKEDLELQCLYAVQAYDCRLEHPQGLLYGIFHCLWDNNLLSSESFIKWETSKDSSEQVGKGVALKSLTSFFTTMREGDEESEES